MATRSKSERIERYRRYAKIRNGCGYTDYAVSKATGIASSYFSDWKHGVSEPKVDKMVKIASLLGVTVEELVV